MSTLPEDLGPPERFRRRARFLERGEAAMDREDLLDVQPQAIDGVEKWTRFAMLAGGSFGLFAGVNESASIRILSFGRNTISIPALCMFPA